MQAANNIAQGMSVFKITHHVDALPALNAAAPGVPAMNHLIKWNQKILLSLRQDQLLFCGEDSGASGATEVPGISCIISHFRFTVLASKCIHVYSVMNTAMFITIPG